MSVKIGGFAAFCIALVVVGGVERVTHCITHRPKAARKSAPRAAFWVALDKEIAALGDQKFESALELRKAIFPKVETAHRMAVLDAIDCDELAEFQRLFENKLEALIEPK
jgi:hypothetical protein